MVAGIFKNFVQGFPNSIKGWREYEILPGEIFMSGGGNRRRSYFDHSNLSKAKNNIL